MNRCDSNHIVNQDNQEEEPRRPRVRIAAPSNSGRGKKNTSRSMAQEEEEDHPFLTYGDAVAYYNTESQGYLFSNG